MTHPSTLGELKETGYRPRTVKQEMRENLIARLRKQERLFVGIVGYDDTVLPQVVHAVLSMHDMLFLGLRGQAKTRMLRLLPTLLDDAIPIVAGTEIPDDPIQPRFRQTRAMIAEHGDRTPIRWLHRDERYNEKLATPDVTIADLLGEVDLVKHAEGRTLADESIMHFGLVPRSNRGIFAINELPDLTPRIQVGLFNVLEERDVQIRGFPVRLPLDVCLVFSANPEDYTNRGRIVTPLKDRIGSVIRTHYPLRTEDALRITRENAWIRRGDACEIVAPPLMLEIVEELVRLARSSPHISQQSGVSVRTSITCVETMVSSAERRAILLGESKAVPRISDLGFIVASCRGKIELMLSDDERTEDKVVSALLGEAVKNVFEQHGDPKDFEPLVEHVHRKKVNIEVGDLVGAAELVEKTESLPELRKQAARICTAAGLSPEDPPMMACVIEFILEALHVNNRLSKYAYQGRQFYKR